VSSLRVDLDQGDLLLLVGATSNVLPTNRFADVELAVERE